MQRTTPTTMQTKQPARHWARAVMAIAVLAAGSAAQAAVMTYQLLPGSAYERTRLDPATQLPVASASVGIGGTIRIDTATGALVSAQFDLGDYTEYFDFAPLTPFTNYALVDHDDELQTVGSGAIGSVAGTVIHFTGANAWSATASGSASCASSGGTLGNAACGGAALANWSPFAIDLLFTPDFSAVYASTGWTDNGATSDSHTLNLFAVRTSEVPVPGAAWLLGSGLAALIASRRQRNA